MRLGLNCIHKGTCVGAFFKKIILPLDKKIEYGTLERIIL